MRKFVMICMIWFMALCTQIQGDLCSFNYVIQYDSSTKDAYELKSKVESVYENMMKGLKEEDKALMFLSSIDSFYVEDNLDVAYEKGTLYVEQGNKEGVSIHGIFKEGEFCMPEVKPKSLLRRLFRF